MKGGKKVKKPVSKAPVFDAGTRLHHLQLGGYLSVTSFADFVQVDQRSSSDNLPARLRETRKTKKIKRR